MDNVQSDLMNLLGSQEFIAEVLSRAEAENLAGAIRKRFGNEKAKSDPIWETLKQSKSYQGETGTNYVKQLLTNISDDLILLIDDWHGYSALKIATGIQLLWLLEQSYNFVWYVTDLKMTFLLCRNDHNFVIVCK